MPSIRSLLTLAPLALALPLEPRQASCPTGVHIIAARGSTEQPGEGKLQDLSNLIKAQIPGSTDEPVIYPATLGFYESSEETGVTDMTTLITNFVNSCPDSKVVLTGFSQGAQIVGDTLGGGTFGDRPTEPLPEQFRKNILAAVQFGDPAYVPGKSYDKADAKGHGFFKREDTTQLDTYSAQLGSWCQSGDPVCEEGFHLGKHTSEVETFQNDALAFVVGLAKAAGVGAPKSSNSTLTPRHSSWGSASWEWPKLRREFTISG